MEYRGIRAGITMYILNAFEQKHVHLVCVGIGYSHSHSSFVNHRPLVISKKRVILAFKSRTVNN
jgi:hypothetical protein